MGYMKAEKFGNSWFYSIGENPSDFWGNQSYAQYLRDFIEIPELNAVINYRARCESMVKFEIVDKQTGKPVEKKAPIIDVLKRPNWFQGQKEFMIQRSLFRQIFGNEYIYFLRPVGMPDSFKGMFSLPPQCMYITTKTKRFFLEAERPKDIQYYFKEDNDVNGLPIDIKDLIHLNDNRVNYEVDKSENNNLRRNYLYGTSKIASITPALQNIRVAYEGRNMLRKMPVGILSNRGKDVAGQVPMKKEEKDDLQANLKQYGIGRSKLQLILSGLTLGFSETIVDINKLKLFEEVIDDTKVVCRAIGTPFELMDVNSTYENKIVAERAMYQNTIIPSVNELTDAYNNFIDPEGNNTWKLTGTFDHLPVFQENIMERAQAIKVIGEALANLLQIGAISLDQVKAELSKYKL
jgi:hypothetical protein